MDLTRLKPLLPPAVAAQADVLWRRFTARERDGDINDFVAALHADGHIDADQLRAILSGLDVSLTLSEGIAIAPAPHRHKLLGLLGKGAMGEVFIGRDPDLRRNVAIKRMDARHTSNDSLSARFAAEVQITAQLDHPAIIPVYGLERQPDGSLSYSMKLIRGRTLKQLLTDERAAVARGAEPAIDLQGWLEIFLQVCGAVGHAHTRGVLHRDLKPDNIMVGAFNEVIVMDWGIARIMSGADVVTVENESSGRAEMTQFGLAVGTPRYMSPEQAAGKNDELDGRSDQYGLGLILFELISLKQARSGKSAAKVLYRASKGEKDPLTHLDPKQKIPRELVAIVAKATAFEPGKRYPSVGAMAEDVRRYLRDEAVLAQPDTFIQRMARAIGRNRQAALGTGVTLTLLVLLTAAVGVFAVLGVREVSRANAAEREAKIATLIGATSSQSRKMETALLRYEGLLQGLATTAEERLTDPPQRRPWYRAADFTLPGKAPPDMIPSRFYATRVSTGHPDVVYAAADEASVLGRVYQLVSLTPVFRKIHQASAEGSSDWENRMRATGIPLVWSYVATDDGVLVGYPGSGVYPDDYDPRTQHWYVEGAKAPGMHWEPAYLDESGMGLLVTATRAVRVGDRVVGVAAIDITVGYLIDTFLAPEGLKGAESWLVDDQGKVVVRSSLKDAARQIKEWDPPDFPVAPVLAAMRASPAGRVEVDGVLYAWSGLPTLGWTYLVSGDPEVLLGE